MYSLTWEWLLTYCTDIRPFQNQAHRMHAITNVRSSVPTHTVGDSALLHMDPYSWTLFAGGPWSLLQISMEHFWRNILGKIVVKSRFAKTRLKAEARIRRMMYLNVRPYCNHRCRMRRFPPRERSVLFEYVELYTIGEMKLSLRIRNR